MGESAGGEPDSGAEGFAPPDRGFGPHPVPRSDRVPGADRVPGRIRGLGSARGLGADETLGYDRAPEIDQRYGFPTPPSVPPPPGPMYPAVHSGYYAPPMPAGRTSGMAVTGLVLGVLSLVLFWTPVGPVAAVAGIVFSSIGMSQSSKPERSGMGMAITGLVCSLLTAVIWVAIALLIVALL